jgi:hypothetical protein
VAVSLTRWHSALSPRGALFALALASALAALIADAHTPAMGSAVAARAAASLAALTSLVLLWRCVQTMSSRQTALVTFVLLIFGTRLLDSLTGEGQVVRLVVFALGGLATVIWWEARGRSGLWATTATAALVGAAAALSTTSLALLLLPTVESAVGHTRSVPRRVAVVIGIWLLGGLALFGSRTMGLAAGSSVGCAAACAACPGRGAWPLLVSLFSSKEGLLYASPLLWLGLVGWLCCPRSERRAACAVGACWLGACLLILEFPTACGGFEGLIPLLGIGLGRALAALQQVMGRWPLLPVSAASLAFVIWNLLLMEQYRRGLVPRDDTVAFADVAGSAARRVTRAFGSPLGWPGNWVAASRHGVPLENADRLVGLDLFGAPEARQATLAFADPRVDALLLDGWGSPRPHSGRLVRRAAERASLVVPLACAESMDVIIVAAGRGAQTLWVNGERVGGWVLDDAFLERRSRVSARLWRCPMNTVTIEGTASGEAWIDSLALVRHLRDRQ